MSPITPPPIAYYQYVSHGVSNESQTVEEGLFKVRAHHRLAASQNTIDSLKSQLIEMQQECSNENWDGYGAKRISDNAVSAALNLADMLPEGIVEPEAVPEPSGNLGVEWIHENGSRFLLTPLADGLVYAGILGPNSIHGQVKVSNELPAEIISRLLQYFSKA